MPNTRPRILIQPLKPAVIAGIAQKLPVLIRVQAPAAAPTESKARKPYHLALVIDRSGSMSGAPLIEAIRCTRHIIEQLEPTDVASLVIFDDRVQTLVAAQPVGDRKALHLALSRVHGGGSTNLYGGWKAGTDGLLPAAGQAALTRVILLSDGNANVGEITDATAIATLCAHAAERGVTTSTYGLGPHFNEDLMVEMAKRGGGNHYYGDSASDLFEPFSAEFDFISALCARQVRLSLAAAPQVRIRLLNDYPLRGETTFPVVHLPDIAFGAEAWALVELELPLALAADGAGPLLQVAVTASTPEGKPATFADATLTLPAVSMAVWETVPEDALVVTRQSELAAGKLLEQARAAAEYGDWNTVERLLSDARQRFAEQPWVIEVLESMAELAGLVDTARFRKEALYSSRKMSSRISAAEEGSYQGPDTESASASFLRRKTSQGKAQFGKPEDEKE